MPGLDSAPPLPDGVKSQMGPPSASSFSGIGDMLASKSGGPGPGAAPPGGGGAQGALKAQGDAIKKVLETMVQSASAGKTYFSRAMQLIEQGVAAESAKGPGTSTAPQPDAGSEGASGMKPAPAFAG